MATFDPNARRWVTADPNDFSLPEAIRTRLAEDLDRPAGVRQVGEMRGVILEFDDPVAVDTQDGTFIVRLPQGFQL